MYGDGGLEKWEFSSSFVFGPLSVGDKVVGKTGLYFDGPHEDGVLVSKVGSFGCLDMVEMLEPFGYVVGGFGAAHPFGLVDSLTPWHDCVCTVGVKYGKWTWSLEYAHW